MVFSSTLFLFLFLPITVAIYFFARKELRNTILLIASLLFYAWGETFFVFVMLGSVAGNYVFGILVDRWRGQARAAWTLALAVVANLALLGCYKYANFAVDNVNEVLRTFRVAPIHLAPIHLPIGISFFTFQALSYVIDVYRNDAKVQKNPFDLTLYIALFPQLIAGPIVRYQHVARELASRVLTRANMAYGVRRFVTGLAKKVLIANTLATAADGIYSLAPSDITPGLAWLGTTAFMLQMYYDFSGYSDMAIGLGHMFGFRFRENFNYPLISQSFAEFWRRWHISLTSWFRDYVFTPMTGPQAPYWRSSVNLLFIFFLTGLWHGAAWTFIFFGLYNGVFMVLETTRFGPWMGRRWRPLRHLYALLFVTPSIGLFRADSLAQAWTFQKALAGFATGSGEVYHAGAYLNNQVLLALIVGAIGATPLIPRLARWRETFVTRQPGFTGRMVDGTFAWGAVAACGCLMVLCAMSLAAGTHNPFLYFRF